MTRTTAALTLAFTLGCSTGEGKGEVESEKLFVEDCWDGFFDLGPTFFGANPARDSMMLRVQRGGDLAEVSDGLLVLVNDVSAIRAGQIGKPLRVGLPVGVAPPGVAPTTGALPPQVSLTLYLFDTCHLQNGAVHSVDGTITFDALFSGDRNESESHDRFTDARFDATFVDPRDLLADGTYPVGRTSRVTGWFQFFFQRGQPAQPFP